MNAQKYQETNDVQQTTKIVQASTFEVSFEQHVCELIFAVNMFEFKSRGPNWLFKQKSSATLWVLDTCLIVGLLP